MQILKLIGLTLLGLARQACQFPHSVTVAMQERRHRTVRAELEAERLDRIRNPAKYLGKGS